MRAPVESFCRAGEIELCFETFGDPENAAILLVMGLAAQMIAWPEEFCDLLASRGFYVVRFDNRDSGRSTHLDGRPAPSVAELARGLQPPYTLADMARDAAGLLDHLEIGAAHVVGVSMGGMISQTLAVQCPARVRTLVSVMSNSGGAFNGHGTARLWPLLLRQPPTDKVGYVEHMAQVFGILASPGHEHDELALREMLALSHDRGWPAEGIARQLAAILAAGDRAESLRTIRAPTLVIHGDADPLIAPSGGQATAAAIPGAHLLLIAGMGHDLPRGLWPMLANAITDNAMRGDERPETVLL